MAIEYLPMAGRGTGGLSRMWLRCCPPPAGSPPVRYGKGVQVVRHACAGHGHGDPLRCAMAKSEGRITRGPAFDPLQPPAVTGQSAVVGRRRRRCVVAVIV